MQPIFLHIDLNSYFASAEQQDNPSWRGKPVGVCEHLGGIIIAASVEAKRWGISTGTPVWEARKLYPKIILTKTHPDRYRLYSDRLMKILHDYTAHVEQYSIDEAFLDVTEVTNLSRSTYTLVSLSAGTVDPFTEAALIAGTIKIRMKTEVGDWLTCSIGIGENKLIAKIASDMKKPDGLVVVRPEEKNLLYEKLNLTDIPGIGHRQEKHLNELGIKTFADLRDYPRAKLIARFGIMGHHLHAMGHLESTWKPKAEQEDNIKSIGHMYTLPKEFREKKFFVPVLYKLSEMVGRRLRTQEMVGDGLHFHLHDLHYHGFGKSKRLGYYLNDGREIFLECMKIFDRMFGMEGSRPFPAGQFKLIGVTISGLVEDAGQQSLFKKDQNRKQVLAALDTINEKYGDFTVCRVPVRLAGNVFRDSIGFGRIKERVRLASFR